MMRDYRRDPLRVEILADGRTARLLEPLCISDGRGHCWKIPAGAVTDFASVPRFFWRLLPPWGRYSPAAVVHDWLYRNGIGTRRDADRAFLLLMTSLGVPFLTRSVMWLAVRLFGRGAWKGK